MVHIYTYFIPFRFNSPIDRDINEKAPYFLVLAVQKFFAPEYSKVKPGT